MRDAWQQQQQQQMQMQVGKASDPGRIWISAVLALCLVCCTCQVYGDPLCNHVVQAGIQHYPIRDVYSAFVLVVVSGSMPVVDASVVLMCKGAVA
jgi:hypothetical protein